MHSMMYISNTWFVCMHGVFVCMCMCMCLCRLLFCKQNFVWCLYVETCVLWVCCVFVIRLMCVLCMVKVFECDGTWFKWMQYMNGGLLQFEVLRSKEESQGCMRVLWTRYNRRWKLGKMNPNEPKWSKMIQNDPKWPRRQSMKIAKEQHLGFQRGPPP